MPGVAHVPYPNPYRNIFNINGYDNPDELTNAVINYIEYVLKHYIPEDEVAAFFTEAIQGEGGYIVPPKNFFKELLKLANEYNILLVDDEIQAGFGRTGKMWAIEHFDIEPHIITSSKALASGIPLSACIYPAANDYTYQGAHSTTFGGNPLACASSLASIDVLQSGVIENAAQQGIQMNKRLKEMKEHFEIVGDARGIGLMQAIEIVKTKEGKEPAPKIRDDIVDNAFKKGLLLLGCGTSGIRFIPPLVINREQLDNAMDILFESIDEISK
jgi:4-aminobutyrate aminotransferase